MRSSDVTKPMGNVTGRVKSLYIVTSTDGKAVRFYALDVRCPELVHTDFRDLVTYGFPASYLTLYSKAKLPQEVLLTQTEKR